jgi:hypothetical protein
MQKDGSLPPVVSFALFFVNGMMRSAGFSCGGLRTVWYP